jgi:hypothetical protein
VFDKDGKIVSSCWIGGLLHRRQISVIKWRGRVSPDDPLVTIA